MASPALDRIHLELTSRCNFRCEFCPQGALTRPPGDMDFGLFEGLVAEVARERIAPAVAYHVMGEPLLYRRLPEAIVRTREAGLRSLLITNGSLLEPDLAGAVAEARPHFVGLSLQTPDPGSFALRGARSTSYEAFRGTLLAGLRTLLDGSPETRVSVYLLTTPLKWALFPATRGLTILDTTRALRATVRAWTQDLAAVLDGAHRLCPPEELAERTGRLRVWRHNRLDLSPRLSIETRIAGDWGRRAREAREVRARFPARTGSCHGLLEHLAVLWDGTFAYCCTDYDGVTSRRRAPEVGIARFLELPEVRRDREGLRRCRVRNPACQQCLGGPTRLHRAIRTVGSVLYNRVYRRWLQDPMRYREP